MPQLRELAGAHFAPLHSNLGEVADEIEAGLTRATLLLEGIYDGVDVAGDEDVDAPRVAASVLALIAYLDCVAGFVEALDGFDRATAPIPPRIEDRPSYPPLRPFNGPVDAPGPSAGWARSPIAAAARRLRSILNRPR